MAVVSAPRVVPGFEHVRRFWKPDFDSYVAKILPGEFNALARTVHMRPAWFEQGGPAIIHFTGETKPWRERRPMGWAPGQYEAK